MEQVLMEAKGVNGQLELLEDKIRIKRKGVSAFILHGLRGDKEILIKRISSIQFKKVGMLTNGYIQFSFLGGKEAKGGIFEATQDENTIMFTRNQQDSFEKIKEAIEKKIVSIEKGETKSSNLDELKKLAKLRDKGIITEEEFNAKKKQLLGI
jgi:hypothetical protein